MRVIGLAKPKGAMKVKGGRPGFGRWRLPGPIPDCRWRAAVVVPYQSGAARRLAARGETLSLVPPLAPWTPGAPPPVRSDSRSPVRRGAQARDLPCDAVARICCWSFWLCLGSRLACRVSLGGKASRSVSAGRGSLARRGGALRSCSVRGGLAPVLSASTMSRHVGTRKMVNYAWPG